MATIARTSAKVATQLLKDLSACVRQVKGCELKIPSGSEEMKVVAVMSEIQRLTKGWDYRVEHEGDRYRLLIFRDCAYVDYLPILVVGPTINMLKALGGSGLQLFVDFLHVFFRTTYIDTWFWGVMDQARDGVNDRLEFEAQDMDPEYVEELQENLNYYQKKGGPDHYGKILCELTTLTVNDLLPRINRCKIDPIRKVMLAGCELLKDPHSIGEFHYCANEDDADGLRFDAQAAVLWRTGDRFSEMYDEYIDMYVQSAGINPPVIHARLDPTKRRQVDLEELSQSETWPLRLAEFLSSSQDILEKFGKDDRPDRPLIDIL